MEDGTCTYVFQQEVGEPYQGTVGNFISKTLESVWGSNFHTGDNNPPSFENTTYSYAALYPRP